MNPTLSIILPSFNRPKLLNYGLSSLVRQFIPYNFELIILNDGLDDGEIEKVSKPYKDKLNIRHIFTGQRNAPDDIKWRIPGFAFNIGIKQARGSIIVLTQSEIFHLRKNNMLELVSLFKLNSKKIKDKKIITHPFIIKDDISNGILKKLDENNGNPIEFIDYDNLPNLKPEYLFFMAFYKSEFIRIGGFDEDFIGNCWDDEDMIHRLKLDEFSFIKRDIKAIHLYHPRLDYKSEEVMERWHYNKKIYDERYETVIRNQGKDWGKL